MATEETFIGRRSEVAQLQELLERNSTSLVVLKGRRRIGKSRLVEEFGKGHEFYTFSGLLPTDRTTAQSQRDEFVRQFSQQTGFPEVTANDWGKLFHLLGEKVKTGRIIVLLDEISWMGSKDPDFAGKLKIAWDLYFKRNSKLILILCSSVSTWIEDNILGSAGFLGRPTMIVKLDELPLSDCNKFWHDYGVSTSNFEKLLLLSVTGGVPRYLELINPKISAEENIQRLLFTRDGILVSEFKYIFTDIFGKRSQIYEQIVGRLVDGACDQATIAKAIGKVLTGDISRYLDDLIEAGFISRDYTWLLQNGKISKLSTYRLKDNYIRFYLKYVQPNLAKIEKNIFKSQSITSLPAWNSIMGLQFESLVLHNTDKIKQLLGLTNDVIVFDNPFFQRKTLRQAGCQIDYMIQAKHNTVYIVEIKFSHSLVDPQVILEVQEKINRVKLSRHMSYRSVLIHVNGVAESVKDSGFFYKIIDFGLLLTNDVR